MKLISKDNMSVVITLILVVLLSQSNVFNFLLETYLGRVGLLSVVIFIAINSKVLGLVAVLAIIIIFNYNHVQNLRELEGLENMGSIEGEGEEKAADKQATTTKTQPKENKSKEEAKSKDSVDMNAKTEVDKKDSSTEKFSTTTSKKAEGREGFCMPDRELNILRGKRPNSVPVFSNLRRQSDDVSPFEKTDLVSDFASV
jgi:hypothetical protein